MVMIQLISSKLTIRAFSRQKQPKDKRRPKLIQVRVNLEAAHQALVPAESCLLVSSCLSRTGLPCEQTRKVKRPSQACQSYPMPSRQPLYSVRASQRASGKSASAVYPISNTYKRVTSRLEAQVVSCARDACKYV